MFFIESWWFTYRINTNFVRID